MMYIECEVVRGSTPPMCLCLVSYKLYIFSSGVLRETAGRKKSAGYISLEL